MTEPKITIKKPRGKVRLVEGKCIACGARCQCFKQKTANEMSEAGEPQVVLEKCIGCGKCVKACPGGALAAFYSPEELAILAELEKQGGLPAEEIDDEERKRREYVAGFRDRKSTR